MREKIFHIIHNDNEENKLSNVYAFFMIVVIIISMIPLMLKNQTTFTKIIDEVCVIIFIVDYFLRFITADFLFKDKSLPFLRYPFSFMAIIDLLSIIPSLTTVNRALKALRLMRLLRLLKVFKVFRVFRSLRYSKSVIMIMRVLENAKTPLIAVGTFAAAYVYISALIVFNVEPNTFKNFFEALYWATVSLTTVGYGDIYPTTDIGRAISMLSSVFGIAVVALPASILTSGYIDEVNKNDKGKDNEHQIVE